MTRQLFFPLLLLPAIVASQSIPEGHSPGNVAHKGSNLCDLTNDKMLVGMFSLSQDTTLMAGFNTQTASMGNFAAGRTPDGVRRALLSFNMSTVEWPDDVKVACAEVRLAIDQAASVTNPSADGMTLHKVTKPWTTNGNVNLDSLHGGTASEGDATWQFSSYPTKKWDNPGGDFHADSLSREFIVSGGDGTQFAYFGSTKRMHSVVNEWIAVPDSNYGMLIKSDELANSPISFNVYHGMENSPKLVPTLIVVYTAPSLGYQHPDNPALHHNVSNMPDLTGYLDKEYGDNITNALPNTSGNLETDATNTGGNNSAGNGSSHQNVPSNNNPTSTGTNTNKPTNPPQQSGDNTSAPNNKRTVPPVNNNSHEQMHTNKTDMGSSNANHSYLAVALSCTILSLLIIVISLVVMRNAPQPREMTAEEVIGNDLSLDTDRELV